MQGHFPSAIYLSTDDGANGTTTGIDQDRPENLVLGGQTTRAKLAQLLANYWSSFVATHSDAVANPRINASYFWQATSARRFDLYLTLRPPGQPMMGILVRANIPVSFTPSSLYDRWMATQSAQRRLHIWPGKMMRFSGGRLGFVDDQPFQLEAPDPARRWGGSWLYHTQVKLSFDALPPENEILFINDQAADVEDRHFEFTLTDEAASDSPAGSSTRRNTYMVKVVVYNQTNGLNTSVKTDFSLQITIEAAANDFEVAYFGWNPAGNPAQKALISEFILDPISQQPVLDANRRPLKNPQYDPLIDPATGLKKQLVWVNKRIGDFHKLQFIADPKDRFNRDNYQHLGPGSDWINPDTNFGFLAEALVVPKGIRISDPQHQFGGPGAPLARARITPSQATIDHWDQVVYGNAETYFSTSGIYLFSATARGGLSTVKLVGYGAGAKHPQLFTETFVNNGPFGWQAF